MKEDLRIEYIRQVSLVNPSVGQELVRLNINLLESIYPPQPMPLSPKKTKKKKKKKTKKK